MSICNCAPQSILPPIPTAFTYGTDPVQTFNSNVIFMPQFQIPRETLDRVARIGYFYFYAKYFSVFDNDGNKFEGPVNGPGGVTLLNKVISILQYPPNRVYVDTGIYQQELSQVITSDVNYMLSVFVSAWGYVDDIKLQEWNMSGNC